MNRIIAILILFFVYKVQASDCQTIRINGSSGWQPVSFRDSSGRLTGIAADVANKVFSQLNINIEFGTELPWKRQLRSLESGSLDMMMGAYYNDQRAQKYLYSRPFYQEKISIFIRNYRYSEFENLLSLKGKKGLIPLGGTFGSKFDDFADKHLSVSKFVDSERAYMQIHSGRADYLVAAKYDGLFRAKNYGYASELVPAAFDAEELPVHFLISKKSPCSGLLTEINENIEALNASDFVTKLSEKYLAEL